MRKCSMITLLHFVVDDGIFSISSRLPSVMIELPCVYNVKPNTVSLKDCHIR